MLEKKRRRWDQSSTRKKILCYNCFRIGHIKTECRSYKVAFCESCRILGHSTSKCWNNEEGEDEEGEERHKKRIKKKKRSKKEQRTHTRSYEILDSKLNVIGLYIGNFAVNAILDDYSTVLCVYKGFAKKAMI